MKYRFTCDEFRPKLNYSKEPKNVNSLRKKLISKLENFLKANFDLNEGYKIVVTENH